MLRGCRLVLARISHYPVIACHVNRLLAKARTLALMPKFKLLLAFGQSVSAVPVVYNLSLPDHYYAAVGFLGFFEMRRALEMVRPVAQTTRVFGSRTVTVTQRFSFRAGLS